LVTVIPNVPAVATSVSGMDAVSWVDDTKVVVRGDPFQSTVAPLRKLLPVTVSVNPAAPSVTNVGDVEVSTAVGLLMVNVWAFESVADGAGLATVTLTVPAEVRSVSGMSAVSCVDDTKVVVRAEPPHFTVAPFAKSVPCTVSVKLDPPTVVELGEIEVVVGVTWNTVNGKALESATTGEGLVTVT